MKRLKILIILAVVILAVTASAVYLSRSDWYTVMGSEGHFSKDTYLDGGEGEFDYTDDMRIAYSFTINSGRFYFRLLNSEREEVYYAEFDKSESGYIYISDLESGKLYDSEGAIGENSDIYSTYYIQEKRTNLEKIIRWIKWHL